MHEHDLSRLDAAFFTLNGIISILFMVFVVADRVMRARGERPHRSIFGITGASGAPYAVSTPSALRALTRA